MKYEEEPNALPFVLTLIVLFVGLWLWHNVIHFRPEEQRHYPTQTDVKLELALKQMEYNIRKAEEWQKAHPNDTLDRHPPYIAIGAAAMENMSTGSKNVFIGAEACIVSTETEKSK